jgi:hypothetical protein
MPASRTPTDGAPPVGASPNGTPPRAGRDDRPAGGSPRRARGRLALSRGLEQRSARNPRAILAAVAVNVVAALILLSAASLDPRVREFLAFFDEEIPQEQLTFVETPSAVEPEPARPVEPPRPRDPGVLADRDAVSRGPELAAPDAPVAAPSAPRFVEAGDSVGGRVVSAGQAAVVGVRPGGDPRLWSKADVEELQRRVRGLAQAGGVPGARELDSVITVTLLAAKDSLDSLAVLQNWGPMTADWTKKDSKGGTWGVDASGIRLGKVTIPSALLGLLPMGAQQAMSGNPIAADRARRIGYAQQDIARFRQSGPGNDMFKMLVEELRERKDREREARRRLNAQERAASGTDPQTGRP